jgi:Zn-dependent protease
MNVIFFVETFVSFILAITIHEATHAAVASALGDRTPVAEGRLALAPRRQMATVGTIVGLVTSFGTGGLGWGRPVRYDSTRMRVGPNLGIFLVAISAPLVNLGIGLGIAVLLPFIPGYTALGGRANACSGQLGVHLQECLGSAQPAYVLRIEQFLFIFAVTNILLALINLIPLHPLDGYKMLFAILPDEPAVSYRRYEGYMEFGLLVLFFALPYVLRYLGVLFSPALYFSTWANDIVGHFARNVLLMVFRL